MPVIDYLFMEIDGTPHKLIQPHINFGLAVDVERKDKNRSLLVPISSSRQSGFQSVFSAIMNYYAGSKPIHRTDDFIGTTVSLTNRE